ncbi:RsmB/NOP family class I SAM-dependent RNA methyltransferase [Candidatus Dojkabacteria bacterium]|uniref:RsmB/NOP family class I SAM-dependent RNA methyltransferase n=1 Tax=Candidatus Dojkabacteria bacterium TaxID=2099670 RepID=A0A955RM23_9BACT|nr:RsmB/NOP family class I SAM-dependent RNA methyltransferase [Candidatus Dojkabacteria bacterium]
MSAIFHIIIVMDKLKKFEDKIREIYTDKADSILEQLNDVPLKSFWINTLNFSEDEVLAELKSEGFEIEESIIPFMYVLKNSELQLAKSNAFINNKIYIQQLSSSIPAMLINPKESERILDLTAAPGSKTNLMSVISKGTAKITAVETNRNRFFRLKKNLEDYGIENVDCILADGKTLVKRFPEFENYFDKVLVDAPCSNEAALCLTDESSFKYWNPGKGKSLSGLQKSLLASGFDMLEPGGSLVYSTCTFSVEENEMVVDWLLNKYSNAKLDQIDLNSDIPSVDGKVEWRRKQFQPVLKNTKRILPSEYFEGFFVSMLRKVEM